MLNSFATEKSQWIGLSVFFILAMVLFFIRPLSPIISRWLELGLCSACIFVCGWFAPELKTKIARLLEVLLLGAGVCVLPYLIHLGTRPSSDENLMVDITATILLISVFFGVNMHLGNEARGIYHSLKKKDSER